MDPMLDADSLAQLAKWHQCLALMLLSGAAVAGSW